MNTHTPPPTSNLMAFIFGAIFSVLANPSVISLVDYSLKAFIGGAVWLAFKLIADHISAKLKATNEALKSKGESSPDDND